MVVGYVIVFVGSVQLLSVQPAPSLNEVMVEAVVASVFAVVLPVNVVDVAVMCQPFVANLFWPFDV